MRLSVIPTARSRSPSPRERKEKDKDKEKDKEKEKETLGISGMMRSKWIAAALI